MCSDILQFSKAIRLNKSIASKLPELNPVTVAWTKRIYYPQQQQQRWRMLIEYSTIWPKVLKSMEGLQNTRHLYLHRAAGYASTSFQFIHSCERSVQKWLRVYASTPSQFIHSCENSVEKWLHVYASTPFQFIHSCGNSVEKWLRVYASTRLHRHNLFIVVKVLLTFPPW